MSEYMVEVGLDVQPGNYFTTMGQAINLTKQYSDVASGLPGAVQNLSKSMVNATMSVTGFNKVNSVALDTAAQYEKQLSNIEARAKTTGSRFESLAKTTKSWAREFPIGIGEATKVMETLQQQGLKSERQMASLGKSFIKLGAATGTNSSGLGAELLQLSRTMGNGLGQFQKLSDSLVTTTAKIGGSAPAVVAFSKALAPVAATVGLSQTAVIGLSTAMSRLGEDGYQAANSLNKVLLDMNRAMRDGGPELKAYADLLGTTSDRLKGMFKTDPAEVLAQFSEAVAKAGPNISRTLDALGFDSVRTTRSLSALARSGGPRAAIDTAIGAYGDGSTERAATAAMDGLTDQAERLRETMAQIVGDVGQPVLGFGKAVLAPANAIAGGVKSVTGSEAGQAVFGAAGVGSTVAGIAGNVVTVASIASIGALALKWFKNSDVWANYKQGMADARSGAAGPSRPGFGAAAGFARQAGMMGVYGLGAGAPETGKGGGFGRLANRLSGFAMEAGARYQYATANMMSALGAPGGRQGVTPEMQGLRDEGRMAVRDLARSARDLDGGGMRDAASRLRGLGGAYLRTADVGAARGFANLAAASIWTPLRAGAGLASGGVRALGALGNAVGMTPAGMGVMAGVIGGGALVSYGMNKQNEVDEAVTRSGEINDDVYARFNSFAEATGQAGKGIMSFTAQVQESTQRIMQSNRTFRQAYALSSQESSLAGSGGYNAAVEFMGDKQTAESLATSIISTLGPVAAPEDVARALTDVQKENSALFGDVSALLKSQYGSTGASTKGIDYKALAGTVAANKTVWEDFFKYIGFLPDYQQTNATQIDIASQGVSFAAMRGAQMAEKYGGTVDYEGGSIGADEATRLLEARRLYLTSGAEKMDPEAQKALTAAIAGILGVSGDKAQEMGLGTGFFDPGAFKKGNMFLLNRQQTGEDAFNTLLESSPEYRAKYAALDASGSKISDTGEITLGAEFSSSLPGSQVALEDYFKSFRGTTGVTAELGNAMSDLTDVVLTQERAFQRTAPGSVPGRDQLGSGDMALLEFSKDQSSSVKRQEAITSVLDRLVKSTGGDYASASLAAQYAQAQAGEGTAAQNVLGGVLEQLGVKQAVALAGRSDVYDILDRYRMGQQAQAAPVNSATSGVRASLMLGGQEAQASLLDSFAGFNRSFGSLQQNISAARRSAGVSIGQVTRQTEMAKSRAVEDYELNREYQREDFALSKRRARRDFGISQSRATFDFGLSQARAVEDYGIERDRAFADQAKSLVRMEADYDRQRSRMTEDFNKDRLRANRDYNLAVSRSTRDFNLSQTRAQEDFQKNQTRATADFNKSRNRMMEDYNRQVRRMSEDAARQMYDPFKRIQAQMVMDAGQLVTNLEDQTKAIQKQLGNLSQARAMGLSEQAIKALNLADASNAQQLSRLVGDLAGNTDLATQINEAIVGKAEASSQLMQDVGNTNFQRMAEDFNIQLMRADEDFATASARAAEDFSVSMSRAVADFGTQMSDAAMDFRTQLADADVDFKTATDRMAVDFNISTVRMSEDFKTATDRMQQDFLRMAERARVDFGREMGRGVEDFNRQLRDQEYDFSKMEVRAAAALKKALKRMDEDAALQIAGIGGSVSASIASMEEAFFGMLQNSDTGLGAASQFIKIIEGSKIPLKDMSDDIQAMYRAAKELVGFDESRKASFSSGATTKPGKPESSYDESMKASSNPLARVAKDAEEFDWSATWQKVKSNISAAFDWASVGSNWGSLIGRVFRSSIDSGVNGLLAAHREVEHQVRIIKTGVAALPGLVASVPGKLLELNEAAEVAVEGWFSSVGQTLKEAGKTVIAASNELEASWDAKLVEVGNWFSQLPGKVKDWLAGVWDAFTSEVPEAKVVKDKVVGAFAYAESYLESLDEKIPVWIDKAYDKLWEMLPGSELMAEKVRAVFEGKVSAKSFLNGLASWVAENVPGASAFAAALWPFADGFRAVLENIVDMWNKVDFKLEFDWGGFTIPHIPRIEAFGREIFPGAGPFVGLGAFKATSPDFYPDIENPFRAVENPFVKHAMGGIAYGAHKAWIGEAGYPEAVIPLNQHGAEVLAATMARYVDKADVQAAGMERYASPVTNYYSTTQDYSTQFNGPVTVQAQNPEEMAVRLQARARRQALAQPIRGRS